MKCFTKSDKKIRVRAGSIDPTRSRDGRPQASVAGRRADRADAGEDGILGRESYCKDLRGRVNELLVSARPGRLHRHGNGEGGARRSGDARPATSRATRRVSRCDGSGAAARTAGDSARADPGRPSPSLETDSGRRSASLRRRRSGGPRRAHRGDLGCRPVSVGPGPRSIGGGGRRRGSRRRARREPATGTRGGLDQSGWCSRSSGIRQRGCAARRAVFLRQLRSPGRVALRIISEILVGDRPLGLLEVGVRPRVGPILPGPFRVERGVDGAIIRHADAGAVAGAAFFSLQALEVTLELVGTADALARHRTPRPARPRGLPGPWGAHRGRTGHCTARTGRRRSRAGPGRSWRPPASRRGPRPTARDPASSRDALSSPASRAICPPIWPRAVRPAIPPQRPRQSFAEATPSPNRALLIVSTRIGQSHRAVPFLPAERSVGRRVDRT